MLTLSDPRGTRHRFYIVDMHHHIGVEKNAKGEVSMRNLNPREADGSYDKLRSILSGNAPFITGLSQQLQDQTKFKYFHDPTLGPLSTPPPIMEYFLEKNPSLQGDFKDSFSIDMIVAFPMHDSFRGEKGTEYRSSNERLSRLVNNFPHSLRFIGFGRVNPMEGEKAVLEVERLAREEGLCGLKLHPKSENFTIDTPEVKEVVKAAARNGLPVLFHTDWRQHIDDIRSVADKVMIEMCQAGRASELNRLRLIIGHCGFSFDEHMIEVLTHPCIFGELSGLHGEGPIKFFKLAKRVYSPDQFLKVHLPPLAQAAGLAQSQLSLISQSTTANWYRKFFFGTDFPFLNQNGAIETLAALFSREMNLSPQEVQSILGINALSMIRPKFQLPRYGQGAPGPNLAPARRHPGKGLIRQVIGRVSDLMRSGWTVVGLEYLIEEGPLRRTRTRQAVLTIVRRDGLARNFLVTELADGGLEAVHPLGPDMLPGIAGRHVRLENLGASKAHLDALLGAGPWTDESLPEIEKLASEIAPS